MPRKVSIWENVVFLVGPNVWRFLWDGGGHKEFAETLLKCKDIGPDLLTVDSADGGRGNCCYTNIWYMLYIIFFTVPFVESTGEYGGNVMDLFTDHDILGNLTYAATAIFTYIERTSADGGKVAVFKWDKSLFWISCRLIYFS